jgi:purine nucleoside phosphorylase
MVHFSEMAKFLAIACLINYAAGATKHQLTHEEVTETVQKSSSTFSKLLEIIILKSEKNYECKNS